MEPGSSPTGGGAAGRVPAGAAAGQGEGLEVEVVLQDAGWRRSLPGAEALDVLGGVQGIAVAHFDERDVVRHPLVAKIVAAYGRADEARAVARDRAAEAGPPGQTERRGKKDRDGAGK